MRGTKNLFFFAGLMNVDGYVSLLARLIEDNEPALVAARVDRFVVYCISQLTIFTGALDYQ